MKSEQDKSRHCHSFSLYYADRVCRCYDINLQVIFNSLSNYVLIMKLKTASTKHKSAYYEEISYFTIKSFKKINSGERNASHSMDFFLIFSSHLILNNAAYFAF